MISETDILRTIINLENIKRKIKRLSLDWWWFELGEASIISVNVLEYKARKLSIVSSPPLSLASAINFLIKNLKLLLDFPGLRKPNIIHMIEDDIEKIRKVMDSLMDAHNFVSKLDSFLGDLDEFIEKGIVDPQDKDSIENIIKDTITAIKYELKEDPYHWKERKEKFSNVSRLIDTINIRYAENALKNLASKEGWGGSIMEILLKLRNEGLALILGKEYEACGWVET